MEKRNLSFEGRIKLSSCELSVLREKGMKATKLDVKLHEWQRLGMWSIVFSVEERESSISCMHLHYLKTLGISI